MSEGNKDRSGAVEGFRAKVRAELREHRGTSMVDIEEAMLRHQAGLMWELLSEFEDDLPKSGDFPPSRT